jgi:sugar phosphate permease
MSVWSALPGFLTMDAMMWAANTTMLWHVYKEGMRGQELREWLMVTTILGGVAVLCTAFALFVGSNWVHSPTWIAFVAVASSGIFALMVVIAVVRLVRRIPND